MSLLKREDIRVLAVVCLGGYSFINSFTIKKNKNCFKR